MSNDESWEQPPVGFAEGIERMFWIGQAAGYALADWFHTPR